MNQVLIDVLKKLDPANDNHWTADGLPRLDTVKMLASSQSLTREQVSAEAPGFCRANAADWQPGQGGNTGADENADPSAPQAPANPIPAPVAPVTPVQETKQPEVAKQTEADSEIDALEKALAEQATKVEALRQEKDKLNAQFEEERTKEDDLRAKVEAKRPHGESTACAIQGYLESQKRILEERAAKKELLKESGINLKELSQGLRAPIDAAMARKDGRGAQRPGA